MDENSSNEIQDFGKMITDVVNEMAEAEAEEETVPYYPSKLDRIRFHFRRHYKLYLVGAGGLVVGALGATLYFLTTDSVVRNKQIQILTWKSKQTLEVWIEALGDPGNIIQDLDTGIIYASQGQAARELGVHPSRISNHLNGKDKHVKGHTFKKLGKAMVSE